jgi:hypothetical protein
LSDNGSKLATSDVPKRIGVDGNNNRRQGRYGPRVGVCENANTPCVPTAKQESEGEALIIGLIIIIVWQCVEAILERPRKPKTKP